MDFQVYPSLIQGSLAIPSSKSQTMRAILFAALARGESQLENLLLSRDSWRLIHSCEKIGARFSWRGKACRVQGVGGSLSTDWQTVDAGNSGILLRFLTAIASLANHQVHVTGDPSVCCRPMDDLLQALASLGAKVSSTQGYAPLTIQGPIVGDAVTLKGEDSQPVSALLITAALMHQTFDIHVQNPMEKPWVELTVRWLRSLGVKVFHNSSYTHFTVHGVGGWESFSYHVAGDMSTAAFPATAALVTGGAVQINGLTHTDGQGDRVFFSLLESMGAKVEWQDSSRKLMIAGGELYGGEVRVHDCIDALPALVAVACHAKGKTIIHGVCGARYKECDRVSCCLQEFSKMGHQIKADEDTMYIYPGKWQGARVRSHGDHRLAMALICGAMAADEVSIVEGCECIDKTYPQFEKEFRSIGARMESLSCASFS